MIEPIAGGVLSLDGALWSWRHVSGDHATVYAAINKTLGVAGLGAVQQAMALCYTLRDGGWPAACAQGRTPDHTVLGSAAWALAYGLGTVTVTYAPLTLHIRRDAAGLWCNGARFDTHVIQLAARLAA